MSRNKQAEEFSEVDINQLPASMARAWQDACALVTQCARLAGELAQANHHLNNERRALIEQLREQQVLWASSQKQVEALKRTRDLQEKQIAQVTEEKIAALKAAEKAGYDRLTGLPLREKGEEKFYDLVQYANDSQTQIAVLALDVDFFKSVNDNFGGHASGDRALVTITNALKEVFKRSDNGFDLIMRWGGEEFVVVVVVKNAKEAKQLAERARRAVQDKRIYNGSQSYGLTISGGLTIMNPDEELYEAVARADKATYGAKQAGRNRVMYSAPNANPDEELKGHIIPSRHREKPYPAGQTVALRNTDRRATRPKKSKEYEIPSPSDTLARLTA